MSKTPAKNVDPARIVDQLYDIALDPRSLDQFIDAWNSAGFDAEDARRAMAEMESFDASFQAHLSRADAFLARAEEDAPTLDDALAPFESLAALIVDGGHRIVAINDGAQTVLGAAKGQTLGDLDLSADVRESLQTNVSDLLGAAQATDRLLKLEAGQGDRPALFQIRRLAQTGHGDLALIVSTQYHWQSALGATLEEVFGLTSAEQGVVRSLLEGRDAKSIAALRGTSEGTVRSQIKSILSKMNARSQSEVIRLVLSLRDLTVGATTGPVKSSLSQPKALADWLDAEVWKPFQTLILPDGRRLDYHDMGPVSGAPVLFYHMGYALVRWSRPMLRLAFQHGLRIICPIRAGYGHSDNVHMSDDVLAVTRDDTLALLAHLGISRLPFVPQGNDLIFAVDLIDKHPDVVSEVIGLCARPYLPGDKHYAGMSKWHRFFLSTGRHAPHLLLFTAKAAVSMARRIGVAEMFRNMNKGSPADMALLDDPTSRDVLLANAGLIASKTTNVARAFAMELLQTESDWSHLMHAARETPMRFFNGVEDPASDVGSLAEYREAYPWIDITPMPHSGQLLIYQKYAELIPILASAARAARGD